MSPLVELHQRLDQAQAFGPMYGPGYSNHLPMALHAAWEMGADAARLEAQVNHDAVMLEPVPPPGPEFSDWREGLGQWGSYARLRALIKAEIDDQGTEAVLRSHLPVLIVAPHAALFHGLIRTAHAWEGRHEDELASALAAWAAAWHTLPGGSTTTPMDFQRWRQTLLLTPAAPIPHLRGESLTVVAKSEAYLALSDALAPEADGALRRMRLMQLVLDGYLHSRNFVLLHLITGLRALRVLAAFMPAGLNRPENQTAIMRGFTAAWLRAGSERQPLTHAVPPPAWPELHRAALAQFDDHVLKLVHACWQEVRLQPDIRWRQAATLAIG